MQAVGVAFGRLSSEAAFARVPAVSCWGVMSGGARVRVSGQGWFQGLDRSAALSVLTVWGRDDRR